MTTSARSVPLLYSYWASSCSYRVRIALNMKEIQYDIKPINIQNGEGDHQSEEYQKINPMRKVPALHIDGHTIFESLNIMHYLEETRPEYPLMPTDSHKRAEVRQICEMIQSGIQPLQNVGLLSHIEYIGGKEKRLEWAQYWINRGFGAIENLLLNCSGKYSVGDEITLADCCLVPQVFNAKRYKVDLQPYSTILKIDGRLKNHPAFHKAHPYQQPDCETKQSAKT